MYTTSLYIIVHCSPHNSLYKKQKATGDECSLLLNEADGVVRGMMDDDLFVNSLHS